MEFLSHENIIIILGVLLSISEILGSFSYFKSSSIFEFIVNILKKLKEFLSPKS